MLRYTRSSFRNRSLFRPQYYLTLVVAVFIISSFHFLSLRSRSTAFERFVRDDVLRGPDDKSTTKAPHAALQLIVNDRTESPDLSHGTFTPPTNSALRSAAPLRFEIAESPNPPIRRDRQLLSFAEEDDSIEGHNTDGVTTIRGHTADSVEYAAKLGQTDDQPDSLNEDGFPAPDDVDRTEVNASPKDTATEQLTEKTVIQSPPAPVSTVVDLLAVDKQVPIESLEKMYPWSERYTFPDWDECVTVKEKADNLPDLLHVTFEQSVQNVTLDGWEDEWIAKARYTGPKLQEPKIDFVYNCAYMTFHLLTGLLRQTGVNGSQSELRSTMRPYELNSSLNDPDGVWMASHGTNRYREWDELRYSIRSVERYAGYFTNRIQILVNAFQIYSENNQSGLMGKQRPRWLKEGSAKVQVVSQEEFFGPEERKCLPSFDSLTIENQLYNTKSETDRVSFFLYKKHATNTDNLKLFALSDDMILGKPHAAADLYSPLFGPTLGFKDNAYNTLKPPTDADAERFGEKPFLIYTSWLLNRRFGARKRKGQVHFGHSLSRSVAQEAITTFPRPALRSAVQRFRGETGFQLYSWYVMFHYTMERHREALLWSYVMLRSDQNDDGYLDWKERRKILDELAEGMGNENPEQYRRRTYYRVAEHHEEAGLEPPKVNTDVLWTSLDGPIMIKGLNCDAFDTEDCLGPGFSMETSDAVARNPVFSSAAIFDRVARESPRCGDCLLKLILNRRRSGLGTTLPHPVKKPQQRATVLKALMKFHYTVVSPDAYFYMVTDAEQARHTLLKPYIKHNKKAGQICLNDDVVTQDEVELEELRKVMSGLLEGLLPKPSSFEK
ncbi:uncharacterized protein N0V89_004815 [Didymosphaeria variabile]|uniref:Stealth protein CR3 conserved region 3 domain-containing protein n=1 Tax=Didymosphaeria variabile TaxID=1932322 RepID=A0A9W8XQK4_9PLEO|nr:uncharacterized protein N0V89_004815 [Didymosphaeria variabile]KAJ4356779.1 hypothetical protein N0V89_004815 [Didymosphaeria variabile]